MDDVRITVNGRVFSFTTDKHNIILQEVKRYESGKNVGEERFDLVGYFDTMRTAISSLPESVLKTSECKSIEEVVKTLETIKMDVEKVLSKFDIDLER